METVLAYGAGDHKFKSSENMNVLENPLDKELADNCLVETHTKLGELMAVMV